MSLSSIIQCSGDFFDDYQKKGLNFNDIAFGIAGMTDAPAVSKRSAAVNEAYRLRRKQFTLSGVTQDEMAVKDATSRAAYQYAKGNRDELRDMLRDQEISPQEYINAIKTLPRIDGKPNPLYKDPLISAMGSLSIENTLKIWDKMSDNEKRKTRNAVTKKYINAVKSTNKKRTTKEKREIRKNMHDQGVLRSRK